MNPKEWRVLNMDKGYRKWAVYQEASGITIYVGSVDDAWELRGVLNKLAREISY